MTTAISNVDYVSLSYPGFNILLSNWICVVLIASKLPLTIALRGNLYLGQFQLRTNIFISSSCRRIANKWMKNIRLLLNVPLPDRTGFSTDKTISGLGVEWFVWNSPEASTFSHFQERKRFAKRIHLDFESNFRGYFHVVARIRSFRITHWNTWNRSSKRISSFFFLLSIWLSLSFRA